MSENTPVDVTPACRKVRPGSARAGKQKLLYAEGISAQTVGSRHIHMQLATLPPMIRARAHKHEAHETAIYVISGESGVWYGENLQHHETVAAGEFFYIPANVPHVPYNPSSTEPCVTVIARTDPNDQESVMLLPELDDVHR
ncbi:cupin domain-containing protein [Caballeronia sordidicola]